MDKQSTSNNRQTGAHFITTNFSASIYYIRILFPSVICRRELIIFATTLHQKMANVVHLKMLVR